MAAEPPETSRPISPTPADASSGTLLQQRVSQLAYYVRCRDRAAKKKAIPKDGILEWKNLLRDCASTGAMIVLSGRPSMELW